MAQVKTKKKRAQRKRKAANGYTKPERAIGCAAFHGQTFAEAKRDWVARFERFYIESLGAECGDNISEVARRGDIERAHVRRLMRVAEKREAR